MNTLEQIRNQTVWLVKEFRSDTMEYIGGEATCLEIFKTLEDAYKFAKKRIKTHESLGFKFNEDEDDAGCFKYYNDDNYTTYSCSITLKFIN